MDKINLSEKLSLINEHYHPHIVSELNGQHVKLAKLKGDFVWHSHENEDELFMVLKGWFNMEFRDKTVRVNEGEIIVVPRGIEHRPIAPEEASVLLFEPSSTLNTGNVENALTKRNLKNI
jgi:mannose-6-phosphate isomerase-like protein (cupin superfamily)